MHDRERVIKEKLDEMVQLTRGLSYAGFMTAVENANDILALLKKQPLRCESCSYHRKDGWCNEHGREVKETDYCSFGAWEGR